MPEFNTLEVYKGHMLLQSKIKKSLRSHNIRLKKFYKKLNKLKSKTKPAKSKSVKDLKKKRKSQKSKSKRKSQSKKSKK
jgi:hypothetical protein